MGRIHLQFHSKLQFLLQMDLGFLDLCLPQLQVLIRQQNLVLVLERLMAVNSSAVERLMAVNFSAVERLMAVNSSAVERLMAVNFSAVHLQQLQVLIPQQVLALALQLLRVVPNPDSDQLH
jgi:hypothetical protein